MSAVDVATLRAVLVADTSKYTAGLNKATKDSDKFGRNSSKAIKNVAKAAAGLATAYVGMSAAKDAVKTTVALAKATSALARVTGMSVKEASRWSAVAKTRGIDAKALNMSFITLSKTMRAATKDGSSQAKMLQKLGVSQKTITSGNTSDALMAISDAFAKMPNGANKAAIAQQLFGRQMQGLLPLINKGSGALREQLALSDKYGMTMDKNQVEKALAAAAAQREINMAMDGLKIAFATSILPALTQAGTALANFIGNIREAATPITDFIGRLTDGTQVGNDFGNRISTAIGRVKNSLKGAFGKDFTEALATISAEASPILNNLAKIFRWTFQSVILPVVKRVLPGLIQAFQGFTRMLSGVVKVISGLLSGDFRKMWSGIKQIFSGALKALGGMIRAQTGAIRAAAAAVARGFVNGLKAAPGAALGAGKWLINKAISGVKSLAGKLLSLGKWITDQIKKGLGKLVPKIGKPDIPDLNPFGGRGGGNVGPLGNDKGGLGSATALAAQYGNMVTSGYRPGDPGYHGQNRARDYAGGNMIGFARAAASRFGGRLKELIHTPLGFGIKNGRRVPLGFWGAAVNKDHYDHVHVAMRRGGKAGPGQGGPSVVYGEGKKTEWWVSQEGNRKKNIGYAMEALQSLTGNRLKMFNDGGKMGPGAIKNTWLKAGGSKKMATLMTAIAMAESGGNPRNTNKNTNGSTDYGLWQINSIHGYKSSDMMNPLKNAKAARAILKKQGLGAWVVYNTGAYKKFLSAAKRAKAKGGSNVPGIDASNVFGGARGITGRRLAPSSISGGGFSASNSIAGPDNGLPDNYLNNAPPGGLGQALGISGDSGSRDSAGDPAAILAEIRDELRARNALGDSVRGVVRGEIEQAVLDFFNKGIGGRVAGGSRMASLGVSY